MKAFQFTRFGAVAALLLVARPDGFAASGTWNINGGGSWNTAGNWSPAAVPGLAAGDVVSLTNAITVNAVITNNSPSGVTAGVLNLGAANNVNAFTLTNVVDSGFTNNNNGSGAQINELSTSKGDTIGLPLVLADSLTINNASTNTLNLLGSISGLAEPVTVANTAGGAVNFAPSQSRLANSSGATGTVTLSDTSGLLVGQAVSGANIASGAYITAINSSTTITLSANATNLSNQAITFSGSTYTANTTVNGGTVNFGVSSAYGSSTVQSGPYGVGGLVLGAGTTVKNSSSITLDTPSITLNGDIYLTGGNRLTLNTTNLNLGGGSPRHIYLNSKSISLISTNSAGDPSTWSPTNSSGTFNSDNTGLAAWELNSTIGNLTVQNGNLDLETTVYSGTNYGAFRFSSGTFASFVGNSTLTVGPNVVLLYNNSSVVASAPALSITAGGVVDGVDNANTFASLSGGGTYVLSMQTASTAAHNLTVNGTNSATTATFAGALQDGPAAQLSFTKSGAYTQAFTGTNTYGGQTLVSGGVLLVNGTNKVYNGTAGYYVVTNGGTLGGSGLIDLSSVNLGVTNLNGGKISPGSAAGTAGTLTLALGSGTLDLSAGLNTAGSLLFDIGATNSSDAIVVTSGNLNIGSGLLNWNSFNFNALGAIQAGTFKLLTASSGTLAGSLGSSLSGSVGAYNGALSLSGNSVVLTLTVPTKPIPVISSVTASQTIGFATAAVTLTGNVAASGPIYPGNGESGTVSATINGTTTNGIFTDANGDFSITFNTAALPAAVYTVTYGYAGDTTLGVAANNTSTTLTVTTNIVWTGAGSTNFEMAGNWNPAGAPVNDLVSDLAVFSGSPTANQPVLTTSRSLSGLDFSTASGGWTLSGNPANLLSVGGFGILSANTSGSNVIAGSISPQATETWQAGTGGNLLLTGSVTNGNPATNCSLTIGAAAYTGNVILSPSAGNSVDLVGSNNTASIVEVKTANAALILGGDGVIAPVTTSTNYIENTQSSSSYGAWGVNAPGTVKVNSGTWYNGDLGKNGADQFTGTIDLLGGTLSFSGARYLSTGTINVSGGNFLVSCTGSGLNNGGRFSLGAASGGSASVGILNLTGGFVDLAQANGGNSIGSLTNALFNQSGGLFQNGVTLSSGSNSGTVTTFTIGGNGVANDLSALTLTDGTFISAGAVQGAGAAGSGSVNNFNFMGGTLAVGGVNATYLGSSPTATATANQTNVSLNIGTFVNYGGTLEVGGTNGVGETSINGNYAVSNSAAKLVINLGGTTRATSFTENTNAGAYGYLQVVNGFAALGGSLVVNLVGGYTPASTDQLNILTATNIVGTFTNLNTSGASGNYLGTVTVANQTNATFHVIINSENTTVYLYDYQVAGAGANNVSYLAFTAPPVISGTSLSISGTNSGAGSVYLLTSTNLLNPYSAWTPVWTNVFSASGTFTTNLSGLVNPALGQQFFLMSTNN